MEGEREEGGSAKRRGEKNCRTRSLLAKKRMTQPASRPPSRAFECHSEQRRPQFTARRGRTRGRESASGLGRTSSGKRTSDRQTVLHAAVMKERKQGKMNRSRRRERREGRRRRETLCFILKIVFKCNLFGGLRSVVVVVNTK